jgi:hypothetical protein
MTANVQAAAAADASQRCRGSSVAACVHAAVLAGITSTVRPCVDAAVLAAIDTPVFSRIDAAVAARVNTGVIAAVAARVIAAIGCVARVGAAAGVAALLRPFRTGGHAVPSRTADVPGRTRVGLVAPEADR